MDNALGDLPEREMSFEELIEAYEKAVTNFAFTYVKDWNQAEEITQEVFIKVHKHLGTFDWRSTVKTWLFSITANQCKDHLRAAGRKANGFQRIIQSFVSRNEESPEEVYIKLEESRSLAQDVLALPLKYREVLVLFYYEELSTVEIAKLLIMNASTVRTRLDRARGLLRERRERGADE